MVGPRRLPGQKLFVAFVLFPWASGRRCMNTAGQGSRRQSKRVQQKRQRALSAGAETRNASSLTTSVAFGPAQAITPSGVDGRSGDAERAPVPSRKSQEGEEEPEDSDSIPDMASVNGAHRGDIKTVNVKEEDGPKQPNVPAKVIFHSVLSPQHDDGVRGSDSEGESWGVGGSSTGVDLLSDLNDDSDRLREEREKRESEEIERRDRKIDI